VAGEDPRGLPGHGGRDHPRSLLPRERRRVDPRARPRRGPPVPRQLLGVARGQGQAAAARGEGRQRPRAHAGPRARVGAQLAQGAAGQVQGPHAALRRDDVGVAARAARSDPRDRHPARPAPRQRRGHLRSRLEGLRRSAADRRPVVQAAARRHRRRDRPQRRRQDHAVPHDHGPREARYGHDQGRRDGQARLRRSEPRRARRQAHRLGGDLRRPRADDAGRHQGRVARVRVVVQLPRRRSAEAGRRAVGR
jgi:hypothetical protein